MRGDDDTSGVHAGEGLIGRDDDLSALADAVAGASLVTVTGLGGVGKTSLARALVTAERERHGSESASWCDVTDSTSREEVVAALAATLGVDLEARSPDDAEREEALCRGLADLGAHLLTLDNTEQVTAPVAVLTEAWLERCPELRILVTSRERLGSSAEHQYALGPLALPAQSDGEHALGGAAVELFLTRVRRVEPSYSPDDSELALIGQVVRELDGLPLAIELAAARVPLLGVSALLERLVDRFRVLNRAPAGTVARHSTLQAAIAWSWELLSEDEATALAQCSVFRGGFTAAAAEQVLTLIAEDGSVIDVLQDLLDKSLIGSRSDGHGGKRLRLTANMHAYAEARLSEMAIRSAAEARHASFFAALSPPDPEWVRRERDNLLAVGDRGLAAPALFPSAVRALAALAGTSGGPRQRVGELLDRAIEQASDQRFTLLRARANFRRRGGDVHGAIRDAEAACALVADEGDPSLHASAMTDLGLALSERGSTRDAQRTLEEAAALHRGADNEGETARVLVALGDLLQGTGELSVARAYLGEALAIYERSDDRPAHIRALLNLANVDATASSRVAAQAHYEDARRLAEQSGEPYLAAYAVMGAAFTHHDGSNEQDDQDARSHYQEALAAFVKLEQSRDEGLCHSYLGVLAHTRRDFAAAVDHGRRAWSILDRSGNQRYGALAVGRLACACASAGHRVDAEAYLGRASELLRGDQDPLSVQVHALHEAFVALVQSSDENAAVAGATAREILDASAENDSLSFGVRLARRTLVAELALASSEQVADETGLAIASDGRWFRCEGGERVDLRRRRALRQVLAHLLTRHQDGAGSATTLDELFAAGWPDTRLAPDHAANRVYNVLSELRGMGLRDALVSRDDGYLLDPKLEVCVGDPDG